MKDNPLKLESVDFRPSDFMKSRRPYLFSDTEVIGEPLLDRSFLEYHLESLTKRSQEKDFEHFCRRLAEKEICPNLLPQTGPTGGGDSKVDSETYPVSDAISLLWYEGIGREAASERWAFAISAKQAWQAKVRSDIQGIAETQRGYTLIYFMSNQYIKDKSRAAMEDELRNQYSINVRILDRTWILDKVFQNKREHLAIETLKISSPLTQSVRKGSLDLARESELQELESQIQDSHRYKGIEYQLVEDCIEAATLARELELSRIEVDGRFARAERVADQYGTNQQKLHCAYDKAWTSFFWHDDFNTFNRLYDDVERLAMGSSQVTDIELLANVWQLLWTSVQRSKLETSLAKLDLRTKNLRAELQRLQMEADRPSTALQAQSIELMIDMSESKLDPIELNRIFNEFRKVFSKAEGLVNFPVSRLIKILMDLSEYLPDSDELDKLFESVLLLSEKRESRATSGRMLLKRGKQKMLSEKYYEAIRLFGRAQNSLAMRECRSELISTLALCASAYKSVGLLWAARSNMLLATSLAFNEYWEDGKINVEAFECLQRLIWIELQLGQIPITLAWIEMATIVAQVIELDKESYEEFLKSRETQDLILGILILKTSFQDLHCLEHIPIILENLGLRHSFVASLYTLGYEDTLRIEGWIPQEENELSIRKLFEDWITQPASYDLPENPEFLAAKKVEIHSQVLGCNVVAEAVNNNRSLFIAESIIAAFEALLATSLDSELFPHQPNIRFRIIPSNSIIDVLDFCIREESSEIFETLIDIEHSIDDSYICNLNSETLNKKLVELIVQVILQIAYIPNPEKYFERLLQDEFAFSRAFDFTNVSTSIWNIMGKSPKIRLSDWELNNSDKHFISRRASSWNSKTTQNISDEITSIPSQLGDDKSPLKIKNTDHLKHQDRKILSLIDINLWNKAGWQGTGLGLFPINQNVPLLGLALLFQDENASKKIFAQWRQELGDTDVNEKIRVSIITGIDSENPAAYRIIIGMNPDCVKDLNNSQFVLTSRIHTMEPQNSRNLDHFIEWFENLGSYILSLGCISKDSSNTKFFWELGIMKKQIFICPAWQIGENDFDICGIKPNDKIIIPKDVKHPPVENALARLRKLNHD